MISTEELRDKVATLGSNYLTDKEWIEVIDRLETAEKERDWHAERCVVVWDTSTERAERAGKLFRHDPT